jgi:ribosomal protein S18 acetylase RimI-like enzyme
MENQIGVIVHPTAAAFLEAARPELAEHEADHHLVLGIAESMITTPPKSYLFAATVHDETGLALAALMTASRPLVVASDRPSIVPYAPALWDAIAAAGHVPSHAIGTVGQVEGLVEEWTRRGGPARIVMHQRAYKLTHVSDVPRVSGSLRVATADDVDLVTEWVAALESEALAHALPLSSTRAVAERRVDAGEVFLWCDPEPRTMASSARPTARAVAVSMVYTPPEWRRRGYATACVAAASRTLLARGFEYCVLYTDLSNPTSNGIYMTIGYRPVRDFLMYSLT